MLRLLLVSALVLAFLEARGVAKAAEHLAEMPGLARFHISQAKPSRKTMRRAGPPAGGPKG